MSRWKTFSLLLIVVGTLKVGAIQGAVEHQNYEYTDVNSYSSALINQNPVSSPEEQVASVTISGYSSREEETDSTPFITASGSQVREGVAAANWLPLGTQFRIPELFGDIVFTVEDRMHKRFSDRVDIWFSTTEEAIRFGVQKARIEVIQV